MRLIVVVLIGALLGGTAAADERGDKARQAYEKGMAHFNLDEFDLAIGQFQEAYRNKPDPILLYNIAQAARLGKRLDMSIEYYEKFLNFAPKAANAASVQTQLDKLRKLKKAQTAAVEAGPRSTLAPGAKGKGKGKGKEVGPSGEEELAPAPVEAESPKVPPPEQVTPASTAAPVLVAAPPPPAKKPLLKQWWFWTAVGGGAAVLITGIGVGAGVAAGGGPTLPPATFGPVSLEK